MRWSRTSGFRNRPVTGLPGTVRSHIGNARDDAADLDDGHTSPFRFTESNEIMSSVC